MKKSIGIFIAILLGVFVLFSLLDSSNYALEKRLWRIRNDFNQITQDPKIVPAQQFEAVAGRYLALIRRYPKSALAPLMQIEAAQVYVLKKDFSKARTVFADVLKQYPQNKEACAAALMGIGATYENEQNEIQAIKTYREIIQEYPITSAGLNMPLYVANYYLRFSKNTEAAAALLEAQKFYQRVADDNPPSAVQFNALRLLASVYMAQEKWSDAIKVFSNLLFNYSRSPYLNWQRTQLIARAINTICVEKLKDVKQAVLIYQTFIEKNPKHPYNKPFKELIGALQKTSL